MNRIDVNRGFMALLFAALLFLPAALASAAVPRIGINLSPVNYWTRSQPWLDRMKTAGPWGVQGAPTEPLALSPAGEPSNFPAGARMVYAMVGMDSPGATFDLLFSGTARFQLQNSRVIKTEPGKVTFAWDEAKASKGAMQLIIRSGAPSGIHIVRDDQVALFQAGEIYQPEFLALLTGMSHFRAMDWLRTNFAAPIKLEYAGSYSSGVPLSAIVALANKTRLRPWIPLPLGISDADTAAALDYLKAHLSLGIRPIIEPSNEVWNRAFPQGKFAMTAVTARTGDTGYFYGLQLAHIASITRGYDVGLVGMWQFVSPGRFANVYAGFTAGGGKDSDLEAIGAANYLYGTLNNARKPDALALLVANDVDGALANVATQLPDNGTRHKAWVTIAQAHGWKYWTYEGGNYHLNTLFFGANAEPLRAFYQKLQEDPRATANIAAEMATFAAAGGDAMTIYNLSSPSTVAGYFGIVSTPSWGVYRVVLDARASNDNKLQDCGQRCRRSR